MSILVGIFTCVFMVVIAQLLLKTGVGKPSGQPIPLELIRIFSTPRVIVGFLLFIVSALLWLRILQNADLSYAYPMLSLAYVIIVLSSKFILKEHVPLTRWIGVGIICIGIFLISQS
ncbi:MAG: EamA family transporter [bacterium]|nr:EamA family transporter [bacterium]